MAMTKKELKEWQKIDALNEQAKQAAEWSAFRRTGPVERDVAPPDRSVATREGYSYGWDYNEHTQSVWHCWSSSVTHGSIDEGKTLDQLKCRPSGIQGGQLLYSTKEKALRALRYAIEQKAAKDLRGIDLLILKDLAEREESQ